jgi:hypothetical protein
MEKADACHKQCAATSGEQDIHCGVQGADRFHAAWSLGRAGCSRVIVVSAFGRNNGITSGARLQWAALRQPGAEAELLDAFSTVAECGHLRRATSCRTTYYNEQRR